MSEIARRIANMVEDAKGMETGVGFSHLNAIVGGHLVEVCCLNDGCLLAIGCETRSVGVMDTHEELVAWIAEWLKDKEVSA